MKLKLRKKMVNDEKAIKYKKDGYAVMKVGEDLNIIYMAPMGNGWVPIFGSVENDDADIITTDEVPVVRNMVDTLTELMGEAPDIPIDGPVMTVVTNEDGFMGASMITKPEVQEKLKAIYGDSFLILPSSIHELIIINDNENYDETNTMISEINANVLDDRDVLADHAYRFADGKITAVIS